MTTANQTDSNIATKTKVKLKVPSSYKVVLLNDNYTPMDFVEWVLIDIFDKTAEEARELMLAVHHNGRGLAGIYPKQIAEQKVLDVKTLAKQHGHPLRCTMEEA